MATFRTGLGTTPGATGATSTFGAKPAASTANATPPQKLTYEQLDATTKKLVEGVQYPCTKRYLAFFSELLSTF